MVKKLPSVFASPISRDISHNKRVFYSEKESPVITPVERKIETLPTVPQEQDTRETVELELKKLFKSTNHIFNIPVEITTEEKVYETKIAGRVHNQIITIDNDSIPVDQIKSLKRKDRL